MATDVRPEVLNREASSDQPAARHRSSTESQPRRRWTGPLLLIAAVGVVTVGSVVVAGAFWESDTTPYLTYTVSRSDLSISVTEQGTLESSNNTEITCKVRGFSTVTWVVPGGTVVQPGDELVRLDTKLIEEALSLTKTNTHTAKATLARTRADVAKAEIAINAYLNGRYRSQVKRLEKERDIAQRNLTTAETMFDNSETLFEQGYVTELEVEGNQFTVQQARLELKVKETEIDVLQRFTKEMNLETMRGNLTATKSKLQADLAALKMEESRQSRAQRELNDCVITAERSGLVIYPSAAAWKDTPDIAQGATVRKDQVLLLMPDLTKMQVKVGVHESIIDRVRPGLKAIVTLPDRTLEASVSDVASVTRPAGWWTGNVVKYDTVIELPQVEGLKPGMSAEVEVVMAVHEDVVTVPVAAVVETEEGDFCWVQTPNGVQRRPVQLGDTNEVFILVKSGLKQGDEVILNPLAFVEDVDDLSASESTGSEKL